MKCLQRSKGLLAVACRAPLFRAACLETSRNFSEVVLRTREADDKRRREKEAERELLRRHSSKAEDKYSRTRAILEDLRQLKSFIESNRNNIPKLNEKLRDSVFNFAQNLENGTTTASHDCEAMRRQVWLCDKFLSDAEKLAYKTDDSTLATFDDLTNFFTNRLEHSSIRMNMEQLCDVLWVYATLGFRPNGLITLLVRKIDKMFLNDTKRLSGYYQLFEKFKEETHNSDAAASNGSASGSKGVFEYAATQEQLESMRQHLGSEDYYGYKPGELVLPIKSNEFADLMFCYGALRIESGTMIKYLEALIFEHFNYNNRLLDGFLPKDLSQLCYGYAMFDPSFHFYTITWGLNRYLNVLGAHVNWTYTEKLQMLHYDVAMRYINKWWKLHISGNLQKLIDDSFIHGMEKLAPPKYNNNKLLQEVHQTLATTLLDDQYFVKNVEGYQVPFSRWESRDEPCCIECHAEADHFMMAQPGELSGKILTGQAQLRYNCLKTIFSRMETIKYYQWPETEHLRQVMVRKKVLSMDAPMPVRHKLLAQTLEPHYKPVQKAQFD